MSLHFTLCICMHAHVQYVRARGKLLGFASLLYHVGPGNQTQILRVGSKCRATFGLWWGSFRPRAQVFLGGGSFSTGVSAYEVQGTLPTVSGLLLPKASAQQLPWKHKQSKRAMEQPLLEPQASQEQRSSHTPTTSGSPPARISSGPTP